MDPSQLTILGVDTMNYSQWYTFVDHTQRLIPWTILHGLLSVGHVWPYSGSIPWTIVHVPLPVGYTQVQIPWTIVHGPLSVGHTRRSIPWTIVHCPLSIGHTQVAIP